MRAVVAAMDLRTTRNAPNRRSSPTVRISSVLPMRTVTHGALMAHTVILIIPAKVIPEPIFKSRKSMAYLHKDEKIGIF